MSENLAELWDKQDHWRDTISSKLRGYLDTTQTRNLDRCGREKMFRTCRGCNQVDTFGYHCDLRWCPRCNHRISARRIKVLRRWAQEIRQPKHLVTTQRNFQTLTHGQIRKHQQALVALRRSQVFKHVKGGCVSVEITNETRGWHLHAHWLVDACWVDAVDLSVTWARIIGQDDGAIVKVKDVRGSDYLAELTKYVVKGSEMAKWAPEEILEFVTAIHRSRFFFAFGTLFKLGRIIRAGLNAAKIPTVCECGCDRFVWRDETTQTVRDISESQRRRR